MLILADGNWGPWRGWGSCLSDCGNGLQRRERSCDAPAPANGGRICLASNGTADTEERGCNNGECQGKIEPQ